MSLPRALPEPTHVPLRGGPVLSWGVLAPGEIANDWTKTLHANTDQRVIAVASRSAERAQQFAATHGVPRSYDSYDALVADPDVDVVYVAAPHTEHRRLALLAIAAGKHVLVEKPIGVSAARSAGHRGCRARRGSVRDGGDVVALPAADDDHRPPAGRRRSRGAAHRIRRLRLPGRTRSAGPAAQPGARRRRPARHRRLHDLVRHLRARRPGLDRGHGRARRDRRRRRRDGRAALRVGSRGALVDEPHHGVAGGGQHRRQPRLGCTSTRRSWRRAASTSCPATTS